MDCIKISTRLYTKVDGLLLRFVTIGTINVSIMKDLSTLDVNTL